MTVFLNWLDSRKGTYESATNRHVRMFLHSLIFGDLKDNKIRSIQSTVSTSTLEKYIAVITGFYRWLDNIYQTEMAWFSKDIHAGNSYFYGQTYSYDYRFLVDSYTAMLKLGREYHKWYDNTTKKALSSNFLTLRDEAVFLLTLEGFRIDEVLGITLDTYDEVTITVKPTCSKGRADVHEKSNQLRAISLPSKTCDVINRYILTERVEAEMENGTISSYMFLLTLTRERGKESR